MITKTELGEKHKDVTHAQFGSGDIMFTKVRMEDGSFGLAFKQSEPHLIGEISDKYAGVPIDEWDNEVKVLFTFSKVESITALVHSLIELQKQMFEGELVS